HVDQWTVIEQCLLYHQTNFIYFLFFAPLPPFLCLFFLLFVSLVFLCFDPFPLIFFLYIYIYTLHISLLVNPSPTQIPLLLLFLQ
ncbi:uncharacterized protein BX664DRAFT_286034, partial [Halteromyces radiatus]|uniref:uncharacterized protein n=1 Tax=Halteromyces radiatus TaxID=101107 RepID=UPI00221E6334